MLAQGTEQQGYCEDKKCLKEEKIIWVSFLEAIWPLLYTFVPFRGMSVWLSCGVIWVPYSMAWKWLELLQDTVTRAAVPEKTCTCTDTGGMRVLDQAGGTSGANWQL